MTSTCRVLVVGPRRRLLSSLAAAGVPYAVWSERRRSYTGADYIHVAPIGPGRASSRREAERIAAHGPFTHVIAGIEAAVMPAAVARRVLGARTFARTTVLRCHDKLAMKTHLVARGIPMTPFIDGNHGAEAREIVARLGLPVVVKPRRLSGGREVELIHDVEALSLDRRRGRLLEGYVDAPEASVESFVSGGEILFASVTEYARKAHVNVVPAGLEASIKTALLELNRRTIRALNVNWGITHLEAYLTDDGPWFGEIALRPPGGYIMELLGLVWRFDAWDAFVAMELDRPFAFPRASSSHAAAIVLHPGPGRVVSVCGLEDVRADPHVVRARVRVRPGERVGAREGVGVDVGHVLLQAPTRDALLDAVASVEARLQLVVENDE